MAAWKAFNAEGDSEDEDDDAPRNPFDRPRGRTPHVLMVSAWSDEVKTTARMPRNKPCAIVHGGAHIGVSHGVHCLTVSVEADGRVRHVSTNQALSYVAKGKPNRKPSWPPLTEPARRWWRLSDPASCTGPPRRRRILPRAVCIRYSTSRRRLDRSFGSPRGGCRPPKFRRGARARCQAGLRER